MDGGSKTIDRVGSILRALEQGPREGMTSGQIAAATGFDKATTYRALVSLERTGLVDREVTSRRFRLGVYLFNLGAVAARRFSVLSHARETMKMLARETGDTVFLSVRNKFDAVCIDCVTGSYPIRAQTLTIGDSLPLGVSAAGVAILATMPDSEVRHAIQYNAVAISSFRSVRPEEIVAHVEQARAAGYARYLGQIVAGMGGVARAVRDAHGGCIAVLTVTALLDRLTDQRSRWIAGLLGDGAVEIERQARLVGNPLETVG